MRLLSPPCGYCRGRDHPWGFPNQKAGQQRRAENGTEFIYFSIRALAATGVAAQRGFQVRSLLERPEDLGRTHRRTPASIWQHSELRKLGQRTGFQSAAEHQRQSGIDVKKPTRLLSNTPGVENFGIARWPEFDAAG